jgi:alcohol dehydrogenase
MPIGELESPLPETSVTTMNALVYHDPGKPSWESHPRAVLRHPGDAIVRITTSTIRGSDLHILKGDVPSVAEGRILGHEGIGVVDEVGETVADFKKGDKVLISCITAGGKE